MRMAFLPDYYLPHVGGMEIWTYQVAKHLAKRGHDVTIYTYRTAKHRNDELSEGITIKRVGIPLITKPHSYLLRGISLISGLPKPLLREHYDVYLTTYSSQLLCKVLRRSPIVSVWHGYFGLEYSLQSKGFLKGVLRYLIEKLALEQNVDFIIVVSEYLKNILFKHNPKINPEKIGVIYGGIDLDEIRSVNVGGKKNQICFVGRFEFEKRPHHVLEVFSQIRINFPGMKLIMVGGGRLLPFIKELTNQQYKTLQDSIVFKGLVTEYEKIKIMKESKLLVRPSVMDAFPLTTLEALACGTPFLAYDIPPLREQVEATEGGILTPVDEPEKMAEVAKNLLGDENFLNKLAIIGRSNVERKFGWESITDKLDNLLGRIEQGYYS